jgi:TPR repeat protein
MPPKRRAEDACTADEGKRCRTTIEGIAEEFLCPITRELPFDPVTAEDGRVYERSALEKWFAKKAAGEVRSPITNEPMGRKLLPAVQVRNTIKGMVQSGALSGEKADVWKKRLKEEEKVEETRRKAEAGDANAMHDLGGWYRDGRHGLVKNDKQAFAWFKRSADKDNVYGLGACGIAYVFGDGVKKRVGQGSMMVARAAEMGGEHDCYTIGFWYEHGLHYFEKDAQEAVKWYKKMANARTKNSPDECREEAAAFVREHGS